MEVIHSDAFDSRTLDFVSIFLNYFNVNIRDNLARLCRIVASNEQKKNEQRSTETWKNSKIDIHQELSHD
jgi:hypothetical protein